MALDEYLARRNFERTPEPRGPSVRHAPARGDSFTVQQHAARSLHYDFRLELDGVLLSWAVPKGPSLDPKVKRLAMRTEDHPLEYGTFEGVIPKGEYGAGAVLVWDHGTWVAQGDAHEGLRRGRLRFELQGAKLRGGWHLVRTQSDGGKAWLLFKGSDAEARRGDAAEIVEAAPRSTLSGRAIEDVRSDPDRVWHSEPPTAGSELAEVPRRLPGKRELAKARTAAMPAFVEPQLATLVSAPPGPGYLHEIKLDGYRLLARLQRGRVRLLTRRGHDWSARFPALKRAFEALPIDAALFDGEVVVLSPSGVSSFQRLQNALSGERDEACVYFAFDLLHLLGHDLRKLALLERKRMLEQTLTSVGARQGRIRYCDHDQSDGDAFLEQACRLKLEGVVSKRADAPYTSGRGRAWVKLKCQARQELVIGGYTEPAGSRRHFGALLLGEHDEAGRLIYAGKVGTGFSDRTLAEVHARLRRLEQRAPAFANPPRGAEARGVHWLRPKLVAEIAFAERTQDGRVRHATFLGLREDKAAAHVRTEPRAEPPTRRAVATAPGSEASALLRSVKLTHPDRVLYTEPEIRKRDLALYYATVAPWMLPHLRGRLLTLLRCPDGQAGDCFYQRHPRLGVPDTVRRKVIREGGKAFESMFVDDAEGLLGLVQAGTLEIHTWGSRVDRLEQPDQLVFDIDPADDVSWPAVVEAAHTVRARLEAVGLHGFLKTTGGKGLHVVVPISPRLQWDEAKQFCKLLVLGLVRTEPARYLATASKAKRKGKIYLDYLRNGRSATAVCAYSTRARPSAPVSMPISWEELGPELRSDHFRLRDVPGYLAKRRADPWRDFESSRAAVRSAARRAK